VCVCVCLRRGLRHQVAVRPSPTRCASFVHGLPPRRA
jgi:hypothetical protein